MPKNQSTAARKARAAAKSGAKYTAALRAAGGPLPPHLPIMDEDVLTEGERLVVRGQSLRRRAGSGRLRASCPASVRERVSLAVVAPSWDGMLRRMMRTHLRCRGIEVQPVRPPSTGGVCRGCALPRCA